MSSFLTYHEAFTIVQRILACIVSTLFIWLIPAVPHSGIPYVQIGFMIVLIFLIYFLRLILIFDLLASAFVSGCRAVREHSGTCASLDGPPPLFPVVYQPRPKDTPADRQKASPEIVPASAARLFVPLSTRWGIRPETGIGLIFALISVPNPGDVLPQAGRDSVGARSFPCSDPPDSLGQFFLGDPRFRVLTSREVP